MLTGIYPEYDAAVCFSSMPNLGHWMTCPNCRSMHVVTGSHLIELDWAVVKLIEISIPEDDQEPP